MLKGKHIILGITGSIAAYKAAALVRLLVKEGAGVRIIMTPMAKEFIAPLTMATLSKNPILVDFYNPENGDWNSHVDLGLWSDLFIIAPASANTIAKMAQGIADNLLLTTYLSARCPVMLAPAMDVDMFNHTATQQNIAILKQRRAIVVEPSTGELASGLEGKGRMEEPEKIIEAVRFFFLQQKRLNGKTFLVTAGPTYESIDPVRFIGNHSSGKMGFAIADTLASFGAKVILIAGPVKIKAQHPNVQTISISSALEMHAACKKYFPKAQGAILSAAVADYRPSKPAANKIKSSKNGLNIELVSNPDIAADLGKIKKKGQLLAGFALETENEDANAISKLKKKNFDFIVLNSLNEPGAGFNTETNKITIIDKNNNKQKFELKDKKSVAIDIVLKVCQYFKK
jgi:phosphopantothenoylcysteine decarboxylase / phosphopantothenate---cysteine ligase